MQLTEKQRQIIETDGHILVTGGPGSGKTTVSILKAARIAEISLLTYEKVLFLSFARATVSRIIEAIEHEQQIPLEQKIRIDVKTYHSFFWGILKTYGYLIGLPRQINILTPPNEAIALSAIRGQYAPESKLRDVERHEKHELEENERRRLAFEEGHVCFDLFAPLVGDILSRSQRIRKLISILYPVVIMDEFQDTNAPQWRAVKPLGEQSSLIALADPEQRIYDWLGADPERLNHFKKAFEPIEVDLSTDNHRSPGSEIIAFGNDLLSGQFRKKRYNGIHYFKYGISDAQAKTMLITQTYAARTRLIKTGRKDWSIAILVPTKKMTRIVSDIFRSPPRNFTAIPHTAIIEIDAAILAAEIIAFLMQPDIDGRHFDMFINLLRNYFRGKGGDAPKQTDLREAERIQKANADRLSREAAGRPIRRRSILVAMMATYDIVRTVALTGDPDRDWLKIRNLLEIGSCSRLRSLANEARNIRVLNRGTQFRLDLWQDWRDNGAYVNALKITQQAFVRQHFSTNVKPEAGVVIMNMHKAKGKQFDEVIIFDGRPRIVRRKIVANPDRIVRGNLRTNINSQSRQTLRVSVTRSRTRTTILTPKADPCCILR